MTTTLEFPVQGAFLCYDLFIQVTSLVWHERTVQKKLTFWNILLMGVEKTSKLV